MVLPRHFQAPRSGGLLLHETVTGAVSRGSLVPSMILLSLCPFFVFRLAGLRITYDRLFKENAIG
jgi:hypothetical protein